MSYNFDYNSGRAREARLGKILGTGPLKFLLVLAVVLLLAEGGYLLFERSSVAWMMLGVAPIFIMILLWNKYQLQHVPAGKGEELNEILSSNVISNLPAHPTPKDLADVVVKTQSGRFLALRYGITPGLLVAMAETQGNDTEKIFERADKVRRKMGLAQISGGMIAIAIVEGTVGYENVLRQMRLEIGDLYEGMTWYNYLHGLVKDAARPRRTGGFARDMMFGYIPLLERFGRNLSMQRSLVAKTQIHQSAEKEDLKKVIQILAGNGRQNVALIGPEGSGRTTLVNALAEELLDADSKVPGNLKFRQIFMLDSAALISAASGAGEIENLMIRLFNEAYAAKNIILCLDDAHLFFEEGRGSVDISNILQPVIEAGRLRMILIMNNQKYLEIADRKPTLTNVLNKIMITPANAEETRKVMEDQAPMIEYRHGGVIITHWALLEAYRLSERYVHDIEMPGRALNLLERAADFPENGFITDNSVRQAIEKSEGVKLAVAQDDEESREKLLHLEDLIHQRMVDQAEAVKTVSDALRRAAAGVRNENRPIGTFLFLGPTGVGKTELAKALAEVYFDGEGGMIRLDLNEYVTEGDVARLIAEGASGETSLAAQVMKQPFSVVLLDEIEKAHPAVLATLLQLLDEGILRDAKGREISFRDTIIVATSNAGAELIREKVAAGDYDTGAIREQIVNSLISSGEFRPEFLNRFDEICLFKPLSLDDLMKVAGLLIEGVNKNLASQKIRVMVTAEALAELVRRGYDPAMGARPMRRVVQTTIENIVARAVLSGKLGNGGTITVTREMLE